MQCFYHPERGAVGLCTNCGKAACRNCIEDVGGRLLCVGCQEIARSEQQAVEQEEQTARDRIAARATLKIRIGRYIFGGTVIFGVVLGIAQIIGIMTGSLRDPELKSPSEIISFLVALPFGILIAAYIIWAFYWGEIAAWRFWLNLFRRTGWFVHASLVGWVTLLLLFVTCPYMLGIFYGVFGGGIVEYRRTKLLAGNDGGAIPSFRWIVQHPWRAVALAILIVGSSLVVSRQAQRQQEITMGNIEAPTPASQPASISVDSAAVPQADTQTAPAMSSFLEPITDPGIAAHLTRQIRRTSLDSDPIVVISLEGDRAWINLQGTNVDLPLTALEGVPDNTRAGNRFSRKFERDDISLLVRYEVLSSFTIQDMGCTRTEYRVSIELSSSQVKERIDPEGYGEGC